MIGQWTAVYNGVMSESHVSTALTNEVADAPASALLCLCPESDSDRRSIITLARRLEGEGWRVTVASLSSNRQGSTSLVDLVTGLPSIWRNRAQAIAHVDVVYLASGAEVSSIIAILPSIVLARFFGKRVVVHFGLLESEKYLSRWRSLLGPVFRMADEIVVNSRYSSAVFQRYSLKTKVVAAPVDVELIQERHVKSVQPKILLDRPLEPIYNVVGALAAFRLVKQKYPRAELILTGQGSQEPELRVMVERERLAGVTFRRVADDAGRLALYQEADMYLNASLLDDTPLSLIEAQAAGLPVVTTDAGGILNIVKDRVNGLAVPVSDPSAMADRIIELVEHPELVSVLSLQGRQDALKYSWSAMRSGWVNCLAATRRG